MHVLTKIPQPVQSRYTLAELMARCDLEAPGPADMAEWNSMREVGRERIGHPAISTPSVDRVVRKR